MYVCVFHNCLDLQTKQSVAVTLNPKQEMLSGLSAGINASLQSL